MTDRIKKILIAVLVVATIIVSFIYYNNYQNDIRVKASIIKTGESAAVPEEPVDIAAEEPLFKDTIKVHVAGAVNNPGLYEAPAESRVGDLIELAGGTADDADVDAINLAGFVTDGQQIYVRDISETAEAANVLSSNESGSKADSKLININNASLSQLMSLPGIGEVLGASIIQYRESNGGYKSVEDIMNVSGIGEKRYEQIKGLITVN